MKSTGALYKILGGDKKLYSCRARGKLRLKNSKYSNPIAVGDSVLFNMDKLEGSVTKVLPRNNLIERKSVKRNMHSNVLAANINQVMLVATSQQPRTSTGFIDRILVSAESFRIPQLLIFNKNDLLSPTEKEKERQLGKLYAGLGVGVEHISMAQDNNFICITERLAGKTTLMTGLSGVGKSTFLNLIIPKANQTVKEISNFSKKGTHATTYTEMFQHDEHTFVIDTPGLKEWGLVGMNKLEISDYFPEMRQLRLNCKYGPKCTHIHEPKCAIQVALDQGNISISRYKSYVSLINKEDNHR